LRSVDDSPKIMSIVLFENNIKLLQFPILENDGESGVVLTSDYEKLDAYSTSPNVLFALETAKTKFDADAVYFRYFEDGRGAVPQIYLYDDTNNLLSKKRKEIHIKVWSGCQVPMYIIIGETDACVFDAREKAEENLETKAYETIRLTGDVLRKFSAQSFNNGLFWEEQFEKKHFQFEKSAWRDLIEGLKKVYKDFQIQSELDNHVALKLLVQSLLIKYLEERDEISKSGYFAGTYFQNNFGYSNFCDVIRSGKLLNLLDKLAIDFNGKIFEWNIESEAEERTAISLSGVNKLADYLDGENKDENYVIWRL